jgi:vacuolar-type H+-ATPase subunit I/STV1
MKGLGHKCALRFSKEAHTAIASEALTEAQILPITLPMGLIIMNTVAMSFELISSTVKSLRLLNYEFMEKFFFG